MKLNRFAVLIAIGLLAAVGADLAAATGPADDAEPPITGSALEQASAAALQQTGGGQVTETEVGDEDGYYEVEITHADGRQVDVHLDEKFVVISQESDEAGSDDQAGPDGD